MFEDAIFPDLFGIIEDWFRFCTSLAMDRSQRRANVRF